MLGTEVVTLAAGARREVTVSLDRAGRRLLSTVHALKTGFSSARRGPGGPG
ncbi:MAG: hypothetical protein ACRDMJ_09180 [Solirubrobacteraceae bacterium]